MEVLCLKSLTPTDLVIARRHYLLISRVNPRGGVTQILGSNGAHDITVVVGNWEVEVLWQTRTCAVSRQTRAHNRGLIDRAGRERSRNEPTQSAHDSKAAVLDSTGIIVVPWATVSLVSSYEDRYALKTFVGFISTCFV